ncbi:MAG: FIST C-terminal domain-containing protein [Planctomycetota bacterium]|nr:FIST C-terminal domain-containing protein [Planctomycetota bacterium]
MSAAVTMKWASVLSLETDTASAVAEAITQLKPRLGSRRPDAVFLFVSPHHAQHYHAIATTVLKQLGPHHLLGCSGNGVVGGEHEAEEVPAIAVAGAILPDVTLTPFRLEDNALPDADSSPRRWEAAVGVEAGTSPQFIILADPLSIRADEMLAGLDFAYPRSVKIGGLASGVRRPGQSALFLDQRLHRSGAVGLALSGNVRIETVVAQGCRPFGEPLSITKCARNVLFELNRRPALETLREQFEAAGSHDRLLLRQIPTALQLGLVMDAFKEGPPGPGDFLIRTPIGMDTKHGALVMSALLREGQTVQFHIRDAAAASEDLAMALRCYASGYLDAGVGVSLPPPPRGALLFSCLGRGKHLYGRPDHDSSAFRAHLGDVPLAGIFCNGEIGQVAGTTYVHGFTSCFGIFRATND